MASRDPAPMTTPQEGFAFPDIPGPKLNLGSGLDIRSPEAGWTNMDSHVRDPRILTHDLMDTPWPLETGRFDLVYCSHVLEHIPPLMVRQDGHWRDVLFLIMEEIHRILAPGGLLVVRVPWGFSQAGLIHIQHYRQWLPEWAYYFEPEHPQNMYSSARFRVLEWKRTRGAESMRASHWPRLGPTRAPLTQHLLWRFPRLHRLLHSPSELEIRMRRLEADA